MVNIAKRLALPKNMVMLGVRRTVKGVDEVVETFVYARAGD